MFALNNSSLEETQSGLSDLAIAKKKILTQPD